MLKNLVLLLILFIGCLHANAQRTPGPNEVKLTDSICTCMVRTDMSKLNTRQQAMDLIQRCFTANPTLLKAAADERNTNMADLESMRQLGIDIGKNLLNSNCDAYLKLSTVMVNDKGSQSVEQGTNGRLLRIETKGFNYIVIMGEDKKEHSFIWLHEFPESERFMKGLGSNINKEVRVSWHDLEVYIPTAKGYYDVKEITGIRIF